MDCSDKPIAAVVLVTVAVDVSAVVCLVVEMVDARFSGLVQATVVVKKTSLQL